MKITQCFAFNWSRESWEDGVGQRSIERVESCQGPHAGPLANTILQGFCPLRSREERHVTSFVNSRQDVSLRCQLYNINKASESMIIIRTVFTASANVQAHKHKKKGLKEETVHQWPPSSNLQKPWNLWNGPEPVYIPGRSSMIHTLRWIVGRAAMGRSVNTHAHMCTRTHTRSHTHIHRDISIIFSFTK